MAVCSAQELKDQERQFRELDGALAEARQALARRNQEAASSQAPSAAALQGGLQPGPFNSLFDFSWGEGSKSKGAGIDAAKVRDVLNRLYACICGSAPRPTLLLSAALLSAAPVIFAAFCSAHLPVFGPELQNLFEPLPRFL